MTEKQQQEIRVADFIRDCVNVEKFSACCRECRNHGKTWSCPPFRFKPMELWKNYDKLLLQCRKVFVPEEMRATVFAPVELDAANQELLRAEKHAMLLELLELEKTFPGSMALSAGSCKMCPEGNCTRLRQEPCRNPGMMRYFIEALGGDVGEALKRYFGLELLWGRDGHMPEYYILLGGLLKKTTVPIQTKEMR